MRQGLVTNGAKVYLVALPSEPIDEKVAELNELGRGSGGHAIGYVPPLSLSLPGLGKRRADGGTNGVSRYACDVSTKEAIAGLAAFVAQREPRLDVLVSNAGIRRDPAVPCDVLAAPLAELQKSMWSHRAADWAETFAVNTTAHYFLSVAFMPLLAAAAAASTDGTESNSTGGGGGGGPGRPGRGLVVVTSSCASMHNVTNVDLSSYAASKAATDHLVRLLAAKFGRWYIRVAGINPGCESRAWASQLRPSQLIAWAIAAHTLQLYRAI